MAFWACILRCADGRYYTGHTDQLEIRVAQHHAGGFCDFTLRRRPLELVWSQEFPTRLEALEAERRIKPWSRAKKEALIRGDWAALSYFALPPRERPSTSLGTNGGVVRNTNDKVALKPGPFVSSDVETRSRQPPSTSLGTNCGVVQEANDRVALETGPFVSSEVETRSHQAPSTSLGTNG